MSDELKKVYENENKLKFYFDKTVPCDLYRGQHDREAKKGLPLIYPNPGFIKADGTVRPADVFIEIVDGMEMVRGCRTTKGNFRGISTFDRKG